MQDHLGKGSHVGPGAIIVFGFGKVLRHGQDFLVDAAEVDLHALRKSGQFSRLGLSENRNYPDR